MRQHEAENDRVWFLPLACNGRHGRFHRQRGRIIHGGQHVQLGPAPSYCEAGRGIVQIGTVVKDVQLGKGSRKLHPAIDTVSHDEYQANLV